MTFFEYKWWMPTAVISVRFLLSAKWNLCCLWSACLLPQSKGFGDAENLKTGYTSSDRLRLYIFPVLNRSKFRKIM